MDQDNGHKDIVKKYEKLFNEYSTLKSQFVQLKQTSDDGEKCSKDLISRVKESDKRSKKLEKEIENLQFRNQQLTKRVAVLQDDLKSQRSKSPTSQFVSHHLNVVDEELTAKIGVIQELHLQLANLDTQHKDELELCADRFEKLEIDSTERISHLEQVSDQQKKIIDELTQSKSGLEIRVKELEERISAGPESDACTEGQEPKRSEPADPNEVQELEGRISELMDSLQAADSKCLVFYSECNRLKQQLVEATRHNSVGVKEAQETKGAYQLLKDELQTTVRNYEMQLTTMSEHLATMTEKWSQQQIEIDSMKAEISGSRNEAIHQKPRSNFY